MTRGSAYQKPCVFIKRGEWIIEKNVNRFIVFAARIIVLGPE
jgi:hypothetical protein